MLKIKLPYLPVHRGEEVLEAQDTIITFGEKTLTFSFLAKIVEEDEELGYQKHIEYDSERTFYKYSINFMEYFKNDDFDYYTFNVSNSNSGVSIGIGTKQEAIELYDKIAKYLGWI